MEDWEKNGDRGVIYPDFPPGQFWEWTMQGSGIMVMTNMFDSLDIAFFFGASQAPSD